MTGQQNTHLSGSTLADTKPEQLLRDAHVILEDCGVTMSTQRVTRLVRSFKQRVEGNGFEFFFFLANAVQLSDEQRRAALANPDLVRVLHHRDPTPELAIAQVMRDAR